jgi:hypothetical protein
MTRRRRIGIGLAAFAFIPYALATWHVDRYNWTPINYPVQLHQGEIRTPEFLAEVTGKYVLFLQVQPRKMDSQSEECLLDLEMFPREKCTDIPPVTDLSWKLLSGSKAVADNNSQQSWRGGSFSNDYVRREIGRFDARQGERYRLSINFKSDPSGLNVASPRIVAESIQDWDGFAIETQGTFVLGVLVAIIGLALSIGKARRQIDPSS